MSAGIMSQDRALRGSSAFQELAQGRKPAKILVAHGAAEEAALKLKSALKTPFTLNQHHGSGGSGDWRPYWSGDRRGRRSVCLVYDPCRLETKKDETAFLGAVSSLQS